MIKLILGDGSTYGLTEDNFPTIQRKEYVRARTTTSCTIYINDIDRDRSGHVILGLVHSVGFGRIPREEEKKMRVSINTTVSSFMIRGAR